MNGSITILCENSVGHAGGRHCPGEWGFSAFLEVPGSKILFDTGHTDLYWKNAKHLSIKLQETDIIVLSHHHWDHCGGITHHSFESRKKLVVHPDLPAGLPENIQGLIQKDFDITLSRKPFHLTDEIIFLGEIPRRFTFEKGVYKDDPMLDDTALAVRTSRGTVVLTGCSHAGICNICEYAKEVTKTPVIAVIGGFHLMAEEVEVIEKTVEYFKSESQMTLYPMHCVDFPALAAFYNEFRIFKAGTGDQILL